MLEKLHADLDWEVMKLNIKNRTSGDVDHINPDQFFELVLNPISEWVINSLFDEFLRSLMSKIYTVSKYYQNQF